ncbi:LuxR C-terminal-related transcriptional regulator [Pectobacterium carotovorum]|uniref:helix-turn-helix transcriptional regulator n=1 Tax=Pectobacterium carotovorum TaxID=554 RepID=UPI0005801D4D|nr:LuxR C-terminal-related transcriptional regulator [Pectobacterium carotovorum]KHT34373.1 transcriptional regulator [Pectobacterium carotovorum subsp. carotovorum]MBA0191854.1 transcriptional regulator [Pectobacterium carotovorum]MBA0199279.1 transcriptional regulator [Pectobacterium carotovorum]QHP53818.1 transcriptional regulator [Pectobacterium carotovorum subsp. carotovorum]
MSIEIFSRCPFTTAAFTYLRRMDGGNEPITIVDIEHGIDMTLLTRIITTEHRTFIIILNNRRHAPVMVAKKVLLLSKHAPMSTIKKVISALSSFREIKGKTISLSPNEKIFFGYWLDGISIKTIAKKMVITHKTANNMKNNIYRKYGIKDLLTFLLIARISHMQSITDAEHHRVIYVDKVA